MKKLSYFTCLLLCCLFWGCSSSSIPKEGIAIQKAGDGYKMYIDGKETYIKGVGGTYRLDVASQSGANAFRTWGGSVEEVTKILAQAAENKMYVMQGIGLPKDSIRYYDAAFKNKMREEVRTLAETFKNDTCLLAWGIGNEIELGNANIGAAWSFVEELAQIIKSVDKRHLVSTVISYNPSALDSIAKYVPSLDYVGINVYGPMNEVQNTVDKSAYKGAFMITEWGPTGWWETASTEWKAPIEQTSEEKRQVYEERYTKYIQSNPRCLGSFVFLWGQKEERTPTWFSMFVEDNVDQLPLHGEKTPMVEAMQRVWTGKELTETAPVIEGLTIDDKYAIDNIRVKAGKPLKAHVAVDDKEFDRLTYVWEVLKEATVLGFGGSYEPRPDRVGDVVTSDANTYEVTLNTPGEYRLYVYVLDNTGFVSTVNVPFQVIK